MRTAKFVSSSNMVFEECTLRQGHAGCHIMPGATPLHVERALLRMEHTCVPRDDLLHLCAWSDMRAEK